MGKSSNIITYLHLYIHSKMPNNLNYFSPFFLLSFWYECSVKFSLEKKIISTTQLNYSLSKKKIAHLYTKLLLYYLKLYVKKLEVRTVRQISFFFTYSVTDSYYGEKLSSVSVFFILKLLKTKQKTKIVSSKK